MSVLIKSIKFDLNNHNLCKLINAKTQKYVLIRNNSTLLVNQSKSKILHKLLKRISLNRRQCL